MGPDCVDTYGRTPLHLAAIHCRRVILLFLIAKKEAIDARDSYGRTPLWYAVDKGHEYLVKDLCKLQCDFKIPDHTNQSPLDLTRRLVALDRWDHLGVMTRSVETQLPHTEEYFEKEAEKDQVICLLYGFFICIFLLACHTHLPPLPSPIVPHLPR